MDHNSERRVLEEEFGLTDEKRVQRIRAMSPQRKARYAAASKMVRDLGLTLGCIVNFNGKDYAVIALYPERIGLNEIGRPGHYINRSPVKRNERGEYVPTVSLRYAPSLGYVHVQSVRFANASILVKSNKRVREFLERSIAPGERYRNEFGEFWFTPAIERVLKPLTGG